MQNNEREFGNMEIQDKGEEDLQFQNSKELDIHEDVDN